MSARQDGGPKIITDNEGELLKSLDYDSFGNLLEDTLPEIFLPLGFACGLTDLDTGLVHFGYREYGPFTGRFISPDPLGDTGGDHDLYDYCVDDPVSMSDPTGLNPKILPDLAERVILAAGPTVVKKLGLGIGILGASLAASIAAGIGRKAGSANPNAAKEGLAGVFPMVEKVSGISEAVGSIPSDPVNTINRLDEIYDRLNQRKQMPKGMHTSHKRR